MTRNSGLVELTTHKKKLSTRVHTHAHMHKRMMCLLQMQLQNKNPKTKTLTNVLGSCGLVRAAGCGKDIYSEL